MSGHLDDQDFQVFFDALRTSFETGEVKLYNFARSDVVFFTTKNGVEIALGYWAVNYKPPNCDEDIHINIENAYGVAAQKTYRAWFEPIMEEQQKYAKRERDEQQRRAYSNCQNEFLSAIGTPAGEISIDPAKFSTPKKQEKVGFFRRFFTMK